MGYFSMGDSRMKFLYSLIAFLCLCGVTLAGPFDYAYPYVEPSPDRSGPLYIPPSWGYYYRGSPYQYYPPVPRYRAIPRYRGRLPEPRPFIPHFYFYYGTDNPWWTQ